MIPYGKQDISTEDIQAVVDVLESDYLTQGPKVPTFEAAVATHCDARYGVACNSATSALHLACLALGVGEGDRVWTSPITFVASANCARYCGADVDFVDIDPGTYNLSILALRDKLSAAAKNNTLPKVVIPVHMGGQSCDMAAIYELGQEYDFAIIEDASHAIGGRYRDQAVGSCRYSDITIFSFHPVKIVTSAEGGMALTNRPELAEKMALLRSHGVTREPDAMTETSHGDWYYQQVALGFNYRMTELQAALGLSQLSRLETFVDNRNRLAQRYGQLLEDLPLELPRIETDCYSAFHLYIVQVHSPSVTRKQVFDFMRAQGVGVHVHYIPVHTQPYYRDLGFASGDFPHAEAYYAQALSLPLFQQMTIQEQDRVVEVLTQALKQ